MRNGLLAALILTLAGMLAAVPAGASTIAYQCGEAVCAIDPDVGGAQPRQLTPAGRFAGITRDGATAAWVDAAGALVQAPVAGGAPKAVWSGGVSNQPSMSPDGQRFLWWYTGPDPFGGLNATYINRFTVGAAGTEGISSCIYCTTTHGWTGTTPIAAFPSDNGAASKVCRLATSAEEPGVRSSCVQSYVTDARGGIGFPSGSPDGAEILAVLSPGAVTGVRGRIVRYSPASGGPVADVTQGTDDTTPTWSADGTRVAFERSGQIVVHDLADGAERTLGAGAYPSWGGARTDPSAGGDRGGSGGSGGDRGGAGGGGSGRGSARALALGGSTTARGLAARRLRVAVRCERACRVGVSVAVSRTLARRLGLPTRSTTLASASGSLRRAGTLTLRPKLASRPRGLARRVRAQRPLSVTVRASVRPARGASGATKTLTRSARLRGG